MPTDIRLSRPDDCDILLGERRERTDGFRLVDPFNRSIEPLIAIPFSTNREVDCSLFFVRETIQRGSTANERPGEVVKAGLRFSYARNGASDGVRFVCGGRAGIGDMSERANP